MGHMEGDRIRLEEVHRFKNGAVDKNGKLCWEHDRLFREILYGMKLCGEMGRVPASAAVDSWAVDFALLDENNNILGDTVSYRDRRTEGISEAVGQLIPDETLYAKTGIQKQSFNTIYQLFCVRDMLKRAESFLMLPDYFHYLLTGVKMQEYTNATSTGLINAVTKTWDRDILAALDYPERLFKTPQMPGTFVAGLSKDLKKVLGYDTKVVLAASHDTASAVLGAPLSESAIFLSSGTWSLMGIENEQPILTEESRKLNFTNEGGYGYRYRYLKNIMGLWIVQSIRREADREYEYSELDRMVEEAEDIGSKLNVSDHRFLSPENMTAEINEYFRETGQRLPENIGEMIKCVLNGLADSYSATVKELETMTGNTYDTIHIVGGGSKDDYLNRITAEKTGRRVCAGPAECTALGNIISQMIEDGVFPNVQAARAAVQNSYEIKEYGGGIHNE